ncbi:37S ribosomal protein S22 [Orbilia blumenaviensis]|uniref:37S ribosomal protein S22 n=1 Tax=Orbilia blumenaviensis TaxID=1796055 RepID=A0AAV9UIQ0_9PEZI
MSTARRLTPRSICLFCRLSSRLSKRSSPPLFQHQQQQAGFARSLRINSSTHTSTTTCTPAAAAAGYRYFSSASSKPQSSSSTTTTTTTTNDPPPPPSPSSEAIISPSSSLPHIKSIRIKWQDTLPENLLSASDQRLWNTLYGEPKRWWTADEAKEIEGMMDDGMLFEEAVLVVDGVNSVVGGGGEGEEGGYTVEDGVVSYYGPVDAEGRPLKRGEELEEVVLEEGEGEGGVKAAADAAAAAAAPPEEQPTIRSFKDPTEQAELQALLDAHAAAVEITKAIDSSISTTGATEEEYIRTHPLTLRGRFATHPSTVFIPKSLQNTTATLLKDTKLEHLRERTFLYNPPPVRAPTGTGTIKGPGKGKSGYHPNLSPETHRGDKLDAAVWLGVVMPEVYSVNLGVATEVRRRLGGEWARGVKKVLDVGGGGAGIMAWGDIVKAENMAEEERRLQEDISPSSSAISQLPEGDEIVSSSEAADGTWDWGHGVEGVKAASLDEDYQFEATVVTASPHVRGLASKILTNTTFLPRVPYFSPAHGNVRWDDSGLYGPPSSNKDRTASKAAVEQEAAELEEEEDIGEITWQSDPSESEPSLSDDKKQPPLNPKRSYDLIFASYTLEHIKKENLFQHHIDNLWQLLTPGGVLCLIELGNIDGFNNVASARQRLLRKWIKSPLSEKKPDPSDNNPEVDDISAPIEEDILGLGKPQKPLTTKETAHSSLVDKLEDGMIIAPCTNHNECPMHSNQRTIFKSNDVCKFPQKYQRTVISQRVISGYTDHTNAFFSYLSVRRGVKKDESLAVQQPIAKRRREAIDDRKPKLLPMPVDTVHKEYNEHEKRGYMHLQPRLILPPIKGDHHVTFDVCTAHGDLERWIVPNSFSKKAYTDARKARWGDLWVWGAKTKVVRESKKAVIEREREGRKDREEKEGGVSLGKGVGVGKSKKRDGRKGWDVRKNEGGYKGKQAGKRKEVNRVPFKKLVKSVEGYTREKGRRGGTVKQEAEGFAV